SLSTSLLPEILLGPSNSTLTLDFFTPQKHRDHMVNIYPQHYNMYQMAKAVLIHEIIHAYDYSDRKNSNFNSGNGRKTESHESQNNSRRLISDELSFLNVFGWSKTGIGVKKRVRNNSFSERSPDVYEWENPQETLAVNMEYFLLDPEYGCHR